MSLELVKTKDDKFKEEYPNLIKKINYSTLKVFDPKIDEIEQVQKIIKDFIIEKKRKVYGGYALNLLLKQKDPKLAIYDDFIIFFISFHIFIVKYIYFVSLTKINLVKYFVII